MTETQGSINEIHKPQQASGNLTTKALKIPSLIARGSRILVVCIACEQTSLAVKACLHAESDEKLLPYPENEDP